MKKIIFSFLLLININAFCVSISLPDAINSKKISVEFLNLGGFKGITTQITLLNNSKETININSDVGIMIQSEDSSSQKLIIAESIIVTLLPKKKLLKKVSTFCISPFKSSPSKEEIFTIINKQDIYLTSLLKFIILSKQDIQNSQHAIWACVSGKKDIYNSEKTDKLKFSKLKDFVFTVYSQKLEKGLIPKDTTPKHIEIKSFSIEGSYEFFVTDDGEYSVYLEDSLGNSEYSFFSKKVLNKGFYPIRYMHHYGAEKEKKYFIVIYKNDVLLNKILATKHDSQSKYVRIRMKKSAIFNIKESVTASLNLVDSLGNIYTSFYQNKQFTSGFVPLEYSFSLTKPQNTVLYLHLIDKNNKTLSKQRLSNAQNMMALKGYFYVKLYKKTEATFGLYDSKDKLIEEFSTETYTKGLQMLPYGFMFDRYSKSDVFIKLKEKESGIDIQSEKVFVR